MKRGPILVAKILGEGVPIVMLIGVMMLIASLGFAQQSDTLVHGKGFTLDCRLCHTPQSWEVDRTYVQFNHDSTLFPLEGVHRQVECISCHTTLRFEEASTSCVSCHTDMHAGTVGTDCARCHDARTWRVDDVEDMHVRAGFELVGAHEAVSCVGCHASAEEHLYPTVGRSCVGCHHDDFVRATEPRHDELGFSTDCIECHRAEVTSWSDVYDDIEVDHSFFPLTEGHALSDCKACHVEGRYSSLSRACVSCHREDYLSAKVPDHQALDIPEDCASCHTTAPGWSPAKFPIHDRFYPLEGAHAEVQGECAKCHDLNDYSAVPMECVGCHREDYQGSANPSHTQLNIPEDCATCHTTDRGWGTCEVSESRRLLCADGWSRCGSRGLRGLSQGGLRQYTDGVCGLS